MMQTPDASVRRAITPPRAANFSSCKISAPSQKAHISKDSTALCSILTAEKACQHRCRFICERCRRHPSSSVMITDERSHNHQWIAMKDDQLAVFLKFSQVEENETLADAHTRERVHMYVSRSIEVAMSFQGLLHFSALLMKISLHSRYRAPRVSPCSLASAEAVGAGLRRFLTMITAFPCCDFTSPIFSSNRA